MSTSSQPRASQQAPMADDLFCIFHAELQCPDGLDALDALLPACGWKLETCRAVADGSLILRSLEPQINIQMDAGQHGFYLFGGDIEGGPSTARPMMASLSKCLADGGVRHRIELYHGTTDPLRCGLWYFDWPQATD